MFMSRCHVSVGRCLLKVDHKIHPYQKIASLLIFVATRGVATDFECSRCSGEQRGVWKGHKLNENEFHTHGTLHDFLI